LTIAHVDPDIAGKRVGENNIQLLSWHWPADDELILPIVTSLIDTTILSILNAMIPSMQNPSRKFRLLSSCQEEPNGDGGSYTCNVTPIFDNNTAAE